MKYTTVITCKAVPLQIEGNTEDGRAYYFRARHGGWYLSIVPLGTDDMERVLSPNPVAKGDDEGERMSFGDTAQAKRIIHKYLSEPGLVNRKSSIANVAYDGVEPNRTKAEREVIDGKVVTHGKGTQRR